MRFRFESPATGVVWHFSPVLAEYDKTGTFRLSRVNLVSLDNSQLTNVARPWCGLKAATIPFPAVVLRAPVQKLLPYPLN